MRGNSSYCGIIQRINHLFLDTHNPLRFVIGPFNDIDSSGYLVGNFYSGVEYPLPHIFLGNKGDCFYFHYQKGNGKERFDRSWSFIGKAQDPLVVGAVLNMDWKDFYEFHQNARGFPTSMKKYSIRCFALMKPISPDSSLQSSLENQALFSELERDVWSVFKQWIVGDGKAFEI